ncbi:hypothetical protein H3V53_13960 [Paraburkholderia bengalensis]|uniref:DUF202 domain-containing protein n=1 Tax=Paraburkholderia bengalensis TaxID=2747562 RepID=A0ABU8IRP9_9BURK
MGDFIHEHKVETYKSLITISLEAFKYLALLNGGAAAGMLTGMDRVVILIGKSAFRESMVFFVAGLACSGLAIILAWCTQYRLHAENIGRAKLDSHKSIVNIALVCVILSFAAFCIGSLHAAFKIH